jgi:hypothetical protein
MVKVKNIPKVTKNQCSVFLPNQNIRYLRLNVIQEHMTIGVYQITDPFCEYSSAGQLLRSKLTNHATGLERPPISPLHASRFKA